MPPIQYIQKQDIPERLKRIYPPLRHLYCCGKIPDLKAYKCLVVIGSRKSSTYGEMVCQKIIKDLRGYPIIIISGLALGIDSIAHEAALENNLLTIAVPGSSLDEKNIYPKTKLPLAKRIVQSGGCLLSEYSSSDTTGPWVFPERNRVMAGLGDAVLVVEATKQSGTSITARLALDFNKEVLAVPGSIFSPLSEGPHYLIQQGAVPVRNARDVIEALGLEWKEPTNENQQSLFESCSSVEKELLSFLPNTRDELALLLSKPMQEIQMNLSLLEIKGLIKQDAGMILHFTH